MRTSGAGFHHEGDLVVRGCLEFRLSDVNGGNVSSYEVAAENDGQRKG